MKKGSSGDDVLGLGSDSSESSEDDGDQDDVESEPAGADDAIGPDLPQAGSDVSGVPWVYTRANVKQDRDMVQFYLRGAVQEAEDDFVDAVGEQLGADVSKTDVREAAYVAAMRDPASVATELERWGFESE